MRIILVYSQNLSCPTECRLINSAETWVCKISIRYIVDELGHQLPRVKEIPFGSLIYSPEQVEDRVRRAQRAALNPAQSPSDFLMSGDDTTRNALDFTTNSVCLEIRGPNLTDLSFCDLPGKAYMTNCFLAYLLCLRSL
jgi:hypothetical protein